MRAKSQKSVPGGCQERNFEIKVGGRGGSLLIEQIEPKWLRARKDAYQMYKPEANLYKLKRMLIVSSH